MLSRQMHFYQFKQKLLRAQCISSFTHYPIYQFTKHLLKKDANGERTKGITYDMTQLEITTLKQNDCLDFGSSE